MGEGGCLAVSSRAHELSGVFSSVGGEEREQGVYVGEPHDTAFSGRLSRVRLDTSDSVSQRLPIQTATEQASCKIMARKGRRIGPRIPIALRLLALTDQFPSTSHSI